MALTGANLSTLPTSANATLATLNRNVNAKDVAQQYDAAFNGRTVLAPIGVQQIGAFAFDYQGDASVDMENEATDHWLEDNTAVQDHIGVKPNIITLRGFVSELSLSSSLVSSLSKALNAVQTTLTRVQSYTGHYTPGVFTAMQKSISQAQNIAVQIEQGIARAAQLASYFQKGPAMTKQQQAYFQLSSLRIARVVFTVFTPFQVFDNMIIIGLKAIQSEKTKTMSDFIVTMKQLNFSNNLTVSSYQANYGGRAAQNKQFQTINGGTVGTAVTNGITALKGSFAPLL
jgi:hypothetical protein